MRIRRTLAGLRLPSEAEIIADLNSQGDWLAAMSEGDKLAWASGGLGREFAPWVQGMIRRIQELEPSARPSAEVIREMRGVVIGGAGTGAWLDQLGDFVLARANSTGYRHLPTDPAVLAEIAMLRDFVNRYDLNERRSRLMAMDIFDALQAGYRGELAPTGQYGNQNLQTPDEIRAAAAQTSQVSTPGQDSNSTGGGGNQAQTEETTGVPWLLLAAGAGAVWWWYARRAEA